MSEVLDFRRAESVPWLSPLRADVQQLIADEKIVNSGTLVALLYVLATRPGRTKPTA